MSRWLAAFVALGAAGVQVEAADTIQLKDRAAIVGTILAEKPDQVVVDVGYTVLTIPRAQIVSIKQGETAMPSVRTPPASSGPADTNRPAKPAPVAPAAVQTPGGIYHLAPPGRPERAVRELVARLGEAVVLVRTPASLGSGFILSEDGYLITNFHVIEGETQISIEVYLPRRDQIERKTYKQVRIIAMNKFQDLALLKVEDKDAPKFAWVPLGESESLSVGERLFAIGSPLGLERTVTEGILSTKTRQLQGDLYLQTTAQINPGNSGGPLFNLRGEVVGVTNMKAATGEGIGFAIPVEQVKYFLDHREAYAYDNENPGNAYRYLEPPSRLHSATASPTP